MEQREEDEMLTSADLEKQLQGLDKEIERCWARVQELRKERPALVARIIDKQREEKR